MPAYDAILFDFDGVLCDTEPLHFQCWKEILAPFGVHPDWDWFAKNCIGISERATAELLCVQVSPPLDFNALWAQYPRKKEIFRTLIAKGVPVAPGAADLLRDLYWQYKIAVVSSSSRLEVRPALELAGIWRYFDSAVCGSEAGSLKPAPDPYLRAATLLEARLPLVVEDSAAGVASAQAAGFDYLRISSVAEMADAVRQRLCPL
jgi:HAD superfamily hydrolase (TIGR01509 family)